MAVGGGLYWNYILDLAMLKQNKFKMYFQFVVI